MGHSQRPRFHELRSCLSLLNECQDAGSDALAWRRHLLTGLRTLLGAQVGIASEMRDFARGRRAKVVATVRTGWASPADERAWLSYVDEVPLERTPEYIPLTNARGDVVTRSREQIWSDTDWYRSRTFNERHKASGLDHYIMSIHRIPGRQTSSSIWVHRKVGDKPFGRRERMMLQVMHGAVAPLIGVRLASAEEHTPSGLPPRRREVLDHLLRGESEKEVAAALGISPATTHEHVTAIYRHFGVSSRGELMARFVSRGRHF